MRKPPRRLALVVAVFTLLLGLGNVTPAEAASLDAPTGLTATQSGSTPTFSWARVDGASAYRLQVGTTESFSTLLQDNNSYGTSYAGRFDYASDAARTLYWRVAAFSSGTDTGSQGAWSAAQPISFSGIGAPVPTSNPVTTVNYPDPVVFAWGAVAGAVGYELQYTAGADFSSGNPQTISTNGTSYSPTDSLGQGTYSWKVRARIFSSEAEKIYTPYSATQTVTVTWPDAASQVVTTSPVDTTNLGDSAIHAVSDPLFTWNSVPGARYYRITVARNSALTNPVVDHQLVFGTRYSVPDPLVDGEYYWNVTAYDLNGNAGYTPDTPGKFVCKLSNQDSTPSRTKTGTAADPVIAVTGSTESSNPVALNRDRLGFSWQAFPRASYYKVTVYNPSSQVVRRCYTPNTSVAFATGFTKTSNGSGLVNGLSDSCSMGTPPGSSDDPNWMYTGRTYYYTVIAYNKSGQNTDGVLDDQNAYSSASAPRYFTPKDSTTGTASVDSNGYVVPDSEAWAAQLTSDGSTTAGAPVMSWSPYSGGGTVVGYEVFVTRGSDDNVLLARFKTTETEFQANAAFAADDAGASYNWRVMPLLSGSSLDYFGDRDDVLPDNTTWQSAPSLGWTKTMKRVEWPDNWLTTTDGSPAVAWTNYSATDPTTTSRGYLVNYRKTGTSDWREARTDYPYWTPNINGGQLDAGQYSVRIRPEDASGAAWAAWSDVKTFTVSQPVPSDLSATYASGTVRVSWTPSALAQRYQVRYQTNNSGQWNTVEMAQPSFVLADANPGQWDFQVRALGANYWSDWSSAASYTWNTATVATVTGNNASLATNGRTLSWQPYAGAIRYWVQFSDTAEGAARNNGRDVLGTTFSAENTDNTPVQAGKPYYWRVSAVAEKRTGEGSGDHVILATSPIRTVYFTTLPARVGRPSLSLGSVSSLKVAWDNLTSPADLGSLVAPTYRLRYRPVTVPEAAWTTLTTAYSTSTDATIGGLSAGVTYQVSVAAQNSEGLGAWSDSATFTIPTLPSAPTGLKVVGGNATMTASWTQPVSVGSPALNGYKLYLRRYGSGGWGGWTSQGSTGALGSTISGLTNGAKYQLEVLSVSEAGDGGAVYSDTVVVGVPTAPSVPTVSYKRSKKTTTVKVSGGNGQGSKITKYSAQYRKSGTSTWLTFGSAKPKKAMTSKKLGKGTWEVRATAYNRYGAGAWSGTRTFKIS